jgi:RNA polymerase sigma-54 factor
MNIQLQQKQQLNLLMTQELRQAIALLQYSTSELEQYIRQQELENPLIALKETNERPLYSDRLQRSSNSNLLIDSIKADAINSRDELVEITRMVYKEEHIQKLLKYIIYNLDDHGYFQENPEIDQAIFSDNEIQKGIHLLQQIGPVGIGARNMKECLLLQINYLYPENTLSETLVTHHLDLVSNHKWSEIAAKLKISLAEVNTLFKFLQTLNPWPCAFITSSSTEYVTPDIIVEIEKENLVFQLNDRYLPSIHLNKEYSKYIHSKGELSNYFNEYHKNYHWLLSSIEQRRNTIIKIMTVLLAKQHLFFKNGFPSLQPLSLKEIASEIGMHESTVGRATMNKIIQTAFGSYDLRLLFTTKVQTTTSDSISQTQVKALLQNYIAQENKVKPYSDQHIAEHFKNEKGITISRRTIAKYREELQIPSSSRRKEITF